LCGTLTPTAKNSIGNPVTTAQAKPEVGPALQFTPYQKFAVGLIAFLQFTIILDFMLLSPLGALLMPALQITPAQFGLVVSCYAFSAGIAGICAAGFADRFDRKKMLLVVYVGFLLGTLLCGIAGSYPMLLVARVVTGAFAGLVGSVCAAIVTDLFPMAMRGRVMGITQTAFAASSVLGLPISLFLSSHWGWNSPFLLIVAVGLVVGIAIVFRLAPVNAHLQAHPDRHPLHHLLHTLTTGRYLQGFLTTGLLSVGGFMLMPFVSAFNVHNVGIPFASLPVVYLVTGLFAAVSGPLIGRATDSFGRVQVFGFGCAMTVVMVIIYTHMGRESLWYLILITGLMQLGIFSRMISANVLISGVPAPMDRGAYMSITSSLQQLSGGVAAVVAGQVVQELPDGALRHFDTLGYVLTFTTLVTFALIYLIDRRLRGEKLPETGLPTGPAEESRG
jgi:predicted MFS family arabinose efflux permease